MAKNDYVRVMDLFRHDHEIRADKGGRKIETEWTKMGNAQWFTAKLLTRGGTVIRLVQVPAEQILVIESEIKGED